MTTTPPDEVRWKNVGYLLKSEEGPRSGYEWEYDLTLPSFLAGWDVWDYWERERVHSMRENLNYGDTLFDIGAEVGWCSIVYSTMVGPASMVLVEPTAEFWPNIKATWAKNCDELPLACYPGLIGSKVEGSPEVFHEGWPPLATGDLIDARSYTYLHENPKQVPALTIDRLAGSVGNPRAITIDVEGAELSVLRGAEDVLSHSAPLIWVSVHPDLAERDYGTTTDDLLSFADDFDYDAELLAVDHEHHYLLTPR